MKYWIYILCVFFVTSCARVGSPNGGDKDTLAPKFLFANIDSSRIKVSKDLKELRLHFDEFVMLKDVSKNLVISPAINKIKRIIPSNLGNKYILVQWEDTLKANTTYSFNFGNAITDLNEGNVLPYFNYAFSTGDYLDSLYISGEVTDGMKLKTSENQTNNKANYIVGLYQKNEDLDFSKKPNYITKADEDGYFELNYLQPSQYKIIAFDDENQNSIFDQGTESVAFLKEDINLSEKISGKKLKLFPSKKKVKYTESKEMQGGVLLLFEGNPERVELTSENEKLKDYKIIHKPKSDSVTIWFDAQKQDIGIEQSENLKFAFKADTLKGNASIFYRANTKDEMTLSNEQGGMLSPSKRLIISSNYPITNLDFSKWEMKEDSIAVPFSAKIDEQNPMKIVVDAKFQQGKKYQLAVNKESVQSYYATTAKAYQFNFEIDKPENYGSLVLDLVNAPKTKFWVQLLDESYKVKYQLYTNESKVIFNEIKPSKYLVRMLVDSNENHFWDEADFRNETYAEPVYVFGKAMEIRPLWENVERWDIEVIE